MVSKSKTQLVKINSELYEVVKEIVKLNKIEYPTIKHFVEKAIMSAVGFKKYNIEGIEQKYLEERPLRKVVGEPTRNFYMCVVCDRPFLKNKKDKSEAGKICPNCKNTILHFAPKLRIKGR